MSVHVISWVLRNSNAKLGDRLVLIVLADHANADGTGAWPAVETIAKQARLTARQTHRCLRHLEADGSIVRVGRGPHGTVNYSVILTGDDNLSGVTSATRGVSQMSPEPSLEPSINTLSPNVVEGRGEREQENDQDTGAIA